MILALDLKLAFEKGASRVRAAVLRNFGTPLDISEVADPDVQSGEVLIRVRANGLCGTDLKVVAGAIEGTPLPIVPGHEIAGEVVDGGSTDLSPGQRVACYNYESCGTCRWCSAGRATLCPRTQVIGLHRDGGLAELIRLPAASLMPFADSLPFALAAVSTDSVTAPWHALHSQARITAGETLVVAGAGGLGLNAIQIARNSGIAVAVIDPVASHRDRAIELGAELAVESDRLETIRDWSRGGADVAIETSGQRSGWDSAIACLAAGGRIVCCGYSPGVEYGVESMQLVMQELSVLGSRNGSVADARAALKAVEDGLVKPTITATVPLDEVNESLDKLRAKQVLGRVVVEF